MQISQVKTLLTACIPQRMPILLKGAPGVGKTDIIETVTRELGFDLLLSHPVVADPTDAKGLPFPTADGNAARFLPYGDLAAALKADKPTVWFLDDLGQASAAVQASFMQLILKRQIGEHKLPDCVTFVAATNRKQDRAGVSGILEPVKSRFVSIVEVSPDLNGWVDWALGACIRPEVIAFLRFRPDLLHVHAPTTDIENSPSPRTWAHLSKMVNLELPTSMELEAYSGTVGGSAAQEFTTFQRVWRDLPNPDAVLLDPTRAPLLSEVSSLHALMSALAARATEQNFSRIVTYAQRLHANQRGEFAGYLLRDSARRNPAVQQTLAYVEALSSELGELFK